MPPADGTRRAHLRALPAKGSIQVCLCTARTTLGDTNAIQIDYARISPAGLDFTSQRDALLRLGVLDSHIYVDHGLTGTNRASPGLREALADAPEADTLVATKLDRLARSVRDIRDITDELTSKGVALSFGGNGTIPSTRTLLTVEDSTNVGCDGVVWTNTTPCSPHRFAWNWRVTTFTRM